MKLFDTHFHQDPKESPAAFISKCEQAGVCKTLLCGGCLADSLAAQSFAEQVPFCLFAAGVHPGEISTFAGEISQFKRFAKHPKFAAIGEIGLDLYYDDATRSRQVEVLAGFLELAVELGKPAILHCRDLDDREDAYALAFELLKPFSAKGGRFELHCFTGSADWASKFGGLGAYFGVGGIITFKNSQRLRDMVAKLPADRLLLETDSPYLAPVPNRGKPNHPSFIPFTARALAELRGITPEALADLTFENGTRFLNA